jgi:hypothetical protein
MTSYEYFKNGGAKELPFDKLPKGYGWVTGCGGDGWYWNFFMKDEDLKKGIDPAKAIMCKIQKL